MIGSIISKLSIPSPIVQAVNWLFALLVVVLLIRAVLRALPTHEEIEQGSTKLVQLLKKFISATNHLMLDPNPSKFKVRAGSIGIMISCSSLTVLLLAHALLLAFAIPAAAFREHPAMMSDLLTGMFYFSACCVMARFLTLDVKKAWADFRSAGN